MYDTVTFVSLTLQRADSIRTVRSVKNGAAFFLARRCHSSIALPLIVFGCGCSNSFDHHKRTMTIPPSSDDTAPFASAKDDAPAPEKSEGIENSRAVDVTAPAATPKPNLACGFD